MVQKGTEMREKLQMETTEMKTKFQFNTRLLAWITPT